MGFSRESARHNAQIDGVQRKLCKNAGENRRNAHGCVKQPGHQSGEKAYQESTQDSHPGIDTGCDHDGSDSAACSHGTIDGEISDIKNAIRDVHANGHQSPDQTLRDSTRKSIEQFYKFQGKPPSSNARSGMSYKQTREP